MDLSNISQRIINSSKEGIVAGRNKAISVAKSSIAPIVDNFRPSSYLNMMKSGYSGSGIGRLMSSGANMIKKSSSKSKTEVVSFDTKVLNSLTAILNVLNKNHKILSDEQKRKKTQSSLDSFASEENKFEQRKSITPDIKRKDKNTDSSIFGIVPSFSAKLLGGAGIAGLASMFNFDKVLISGKHIQSAISKMSVGFSGILKMMKGFSMSAILSNPLSKILKTIKSIAAPITTIVTTVLKPIMSSLKGIFTGFKKFGKYLGGPFVLGFLGLFDFVYGFIDGFSKDGINGGIKGGLTNLFRGFISEPLDLIKDLFSWVSTKLGFDSFSEILDAFSFKEIFDSIGNKISAGIKNIAPVILENITQLPELVSGVWNSIKTKITSTIDAGMAALHDFSFDSIIEKVKELSVTIFNGIRDGIQEFV